jgi:hypothetical protein
LPRDDLDALMTYRIPVNNLDGLSFSMLALLLDGLRRLLPAFRALKARNTSYEQSGRTVCSWQDCASLEKFDTNVPCTCTLPPAASANPTSLTRIPSSTM